ncbi:MAG: hypothetical protein HOP30_14080 [Cyclobacteriaceae bacterium]|nr:hypothetical protein [Cyclobacteriaceae bacterium]
MSKEFSKLKLPKGWIEIEISQILDFEYGKSLPGTDRVSGDFPVYGSNGVVDNHNKYLVEGPVIIVGRKGTVGSVHYSMSNCWPIDTTYFIRPIKALNFLFVYYLLKQLNLESLDKSTTIPGLNRNHVYSLRILLPPVEEQGRIVAKLEELLSELDNSITSLKRAQSLLKAYQQDLLNHAFEGRLTEEWRKLNMVVPTNMLLKQINTSRQLLHKQKLISWQEQVLQWKKKRKGSRPNKPKAIKELLPLSENELRLMQKIPREWSWARLDDFADIIGGVTKGKKYEGKKVINVPYLRVANVQDGFLNLNEVKHIKITPDETDKYKLEYGDILYTEGGDKDKLGRGTMWKNEINNCIHQNHIFRARVISHEINPAYCAMYSRSRYAKNYFFSKAKQTTNLASINMTVLSNLPFPLATKAEQDVIVELIESKTSLIQYLENAIIKSFEQARILKQSILRKAFEGKLVDQDPLDEPVSDLMLRIKSEKALFTINEKTMRKETRTKKVSTKGKSILEVLKSSKKPLSAKAVWEQSKHKDDIEGFYSELKKVQSKVVEIKRGILSLANANR